MPIPNHTFFTTLNTIPFSQLSCTLPEFPLLVFKQNTLPITFRNSKGCCGISNLLFPIEGSQKKDMTLDKYIHWVVSLYENVDNSDDDEHCYSYYGYHHYLRYYPSYSGVLTLMGMCRRACIVVSRPLNLGPGGSEVLHWTAYTAAPINQRQRASRHCR